MIFQIVFEITLKSDFNTWLLNVIIFLKLKLYSNIKKFDIALKT